VLSIKGHVVVRKVSLPCGGFGYKEMELEIVGAPDDKDNISDEVVIYKNYDYGNNNEDFWDRYKEKLAEQEDGNCSDLESEYYDEEMSERCYNCVTGDCENCEPLKEFLHYEQYRY